MNILFVDWAWHGPAYDSRSLAQSALGGSESTLVRIATALATTHTVSVAQSNRTTTEVHDGVRYINAADMAALAKQQCVDVCIIMRKIRHTQTIANQFPKAKILVWLHDYLPLKSRIYGNAIMRADAQIITVSHTHAGHTAAVFGNGWRKAYQEKDRSKAARWPISTIYNPIADELQPDNTHVDPNKLVFFSSPHKGLPQVLNHFKALRAVIPSLKLHIANPGYRAGTSTTQDLQSAGIEVLGNLPQAAIHAHVRSALCVFYPQSVFPETFGLVYAEANAMGTPALAHDFGAAAEILSSTQLINAHNPTDILTRIQAWHAGQRPTVTLPQHLRLAHVTEQWQALLERFGHN